MDNLLAVHVAIAANRASSRSALPDAPVVVTQGALPPRRLRISWRLRRCVVQAACSDDRVGAVDRRAVGL